MGTVTETIRNLTLTQAGSIALMLVTIGIGVGMTIKHKVLEKIETTKLAVKKKAGRCMQRLEESVTHPSVRSKPPSTTCDEFKDYLRKQQAQQACDAVNSDRGGECVDDILSEEKSLGSVSQQLQDELLALRHELKEREEQIAMLQEEVRDANENIANLNEKNNESKHLENTAPFLVYCIQAILGYVRKEVAADAVLGRLKEDAETLQAELERNGIEVVFDASNVSNGFDRVRDDCVKCPEGVVAAPMLLRNGVILRRGKILLPTV